MYMFKFWMESNVAIFYVFVYSDSSFKYEKLKKKI